MAAVPGGRDARSSVGPLAGAVLTSSHGSACSAGGCPPHAAPGVFAGPLDGAVVITDLGSSEPSEEMIAVPDLCSGNPALASSTASEKPEGLDLRDAQNQSFTWSEYGASEVSGATPMMGAVVDNYLYVCGVKEVTENMCNFLGITALLCVAEETVNPLPGFISDEQLRTGEFVFHHLPLLDDDRTKLADVVEEVFAFIDVALSEKRTVAVYCQKGKSRSVSLVLAFLMRELNVEPEKALDLLRARYKRAEPNLDFLLQLRDLEPRIQELRATNTGRRNDESYDAALEAVRLRTLTRGHSTSFDTISVGSRAVARDEATPASPLVAGVPPSSDDAAPLPPPSSVTGPVAATRAKMPAPVAAGRHIAPMTSKASKGGPLSFGE